MNNLTNLTVLNNTTITDDLQIKNYDHLYAMAQSIADYYGKYQIDNNDYQGAKHLRTDLNKLSRQLNAERLKKQREYEAPVKDLKAKIDALIALVKQGSSNVDSQVKDIDKKAKAARQEKVCETIHTVCQSKSIDDVPVQNKWITKSMTKANGAPNKKCLQAIVQAADVAVADKRVLDADISQVKMQAKMLGMDADGYVGMLKNGAAGLQQVLGYMKIKHDQHANEIKKEKESTQVINGQYINTDTGEMKGKQVLMDVYLKGTANALNKLEKYANELNIEWEAK